ncbi:N-acetylglucosaminyl transferase component [Colletotrichum tofieldiae]|nr:N-acetylglucosaminyl transferase component [Colletotrichum tofieldiae]GKT79403.1 N-acetylglucosaminyl transferase component [Colletotrichum tofieldiae]GKT82576.1 N-acetylglucosaminyl transferase component [Colletotrichum tofieldiae]
MSASLAPECNEVKDCHEAAQDPADICQVALKERGIDKLLDEAREDQKDNDATYMGRKCECSFWASARAVCGRDRI